MLELNYIAYFHLRHFEHTTYTLMTIIIINAGTQIIIMTCVEDSKLHSHLKWSYYDTLLSFHLAI